MKISREEVLRIADLAHLDLSSEEVELYSSQLGEILSYIGKLQELDVTGIEPMTQSLPRGFAPERDAGLASAASPSRIAATAEPNLRDDIVQPCTIGADVLAHAPDAAKPFFRVPKVIER
ncbi:MAG: Asp-tRNA(Asn)/Glu-tRNA(Gln) amidotransferase subunit GatC [Candidatus Acidiferrales bacterium]